MHKMIKRELKKIDFFKNKKVDKLFTIHNIVKKQNLLQLILLRKVNILSKILFFFFFTILENRKLEQSNK